MFETYCVTGGHNGASIAVLIGTPSGAVMLYRAIGAAASWRRSPAPSSSSSAEQQPSGRAYKGSSTPPLLLIRHRAALGGGRLGTRSRRPDSVRWLRPVRSQGPGWFSPADHLGDEYYPAPPTTGAQHRGGVADGPRPNVIRAWRCRGRHRCPRVYLRRDHVSRAWPMFGIAVRSRP